MFANMRSAQLPPRLLTWIAAAVIALAPQSFAAAQGITPEVLAAAKTEGQVTWYTSADLVLANKLKSAFEQKYDGVKVNVLRQSSSTIFNRANQEFDLGTNAADAIETSVMSHFVDMKAARAAAAHAPIGSAMGILFDNFGYILSGAAATVHLALVAALFALSVGMLAGLLRLYAPLPVRLLSVAYIELFRGTPVLVQMFFIFFGLPLLLGWNPSAFTAAAVALVLNNGAYFAEIVRGGVQAISREQWSAGLAVGLRFRQVLALVVIPQALRRIVPPGIGQFTILVKDTSIASAIGFFEMTRAGQHVVERTLAPFEIFTLVGTLFFAICYAGSWLSRRLERRLSRAAPTGETEWRYLLGAR